MKLTCGALRRYLEKMPDDMLIRFVTPAEDPSLPDELVFVQCEPVGRRYEITVASEEQ